MSKKIFGETKKFYSTQTNDWFQLCKGFYLPVSIKTMSY
jgi:hypothetical protein